MTIGTGWYPETEDDKKERIEIILEETQAFAVRELRKKLDEIFEGNNHVGVVKNVWR